MQREDGASNATWGRCFWSNVRTALLMQREHGTSNAMWVQTAIATWARISLETWTRISRVTWARTSCAMWAFTSRATWAGTSRNMWSRTSRETWAQTSGETWAQTSRETWAQTSREMWVQNFHETWARTSRAALHRGGGVLQAKWDIMVSHAPSFAVRHPCSKLCSYGSGFEERCRKPVIVVCGVSRYKWCHVPCPRQLWPLKQVRRLHVLRCQAGDNWIAESE